MERAWRRIAVGICDIISGFFAFSLCFLAVASLSLVKRPLPSLKVSLITIVGLFATLGILALAGGICALLRKMWGLALAGSISASISLPPFGVPATILMLLSSEASRVTRLLVFILLGPLWLIYIGLVVLILLGYTL